MIGYQYKIQWLFGNFKDFAKLIDVIGAKNLDIIYLRDIDDKIIDSYDGFILKSSLVANSATKKEIKKLMKLNPTWSHIEVLRR